MKSNQKNIDAAQVEGQVVYAFVPTCKKHNPLENFIKYNKCSDDITKNFSGCCISFFVKQADNRRKGNKGTNPDKMSGVVMRKPNTIGDSLNSIEQVHIFSLLVI